MSSCKLTVVYELNMCRRKEQWKKGTLDQIRKPLNLNHKCTAIQKLKSSVRCPSKFNIRARIIAFDPADLIDVMILHCANCKQEYVSLPLCVSDSAYHLCAAAFPETEKHASAVVT